MSLNFLVKKNPVIVTEDTSVKEAAKKMLSENVGTVIVVKKEGDSKACGILTDRDIALKFAENNLDDKVLVKDIATSEIVSLKQNQGVKELTSALCDHGIRRAIILDDKDNIAGIASTDDLLVNLVGELQDIKKAIESQVCW